MIYNMYVHTNKTQIKDMPPSTICNPDTMRINLKLHKDSKQALISLAKDFQTTNTNIVEFALKYLRDSISKEPDNKLELFYKVQKIALLNKEHEIKARKQRNQEKIAAGKKFGRKVHTTSGLSTKSFKSQKN